MLGFDATGRLAIGQITQPGLSDFQPVLPQDETWTVAAAQSGVWTEQTKQSETWTVQPGV